MGVPSLARLADDRGRAVLRGTDDAHRVIEACTGALRPHSLTVHTPGTVLDTRLTHVPLGDVSVNLLQYGTDVTVSSGDGVLDDYLLTLPLAGSARFRYGGVETEGRPGRGVIIGPHREFEFDFDAAWDQLIVRLDRSRVESVAAALTGEVGPVDFDVPLTPAIGTLDGLLESAVALADSSLAGRRPHLVWQFEQLIVETLLLAQPSDRVTTPDDDRGGRPVSPRVRRATEYMLDRLADPLTVSAVAEACGVSVRSVQEAFRRELGTTPVRWLRERRLERAHALLGSGAPGLTVTDIAYQCGFFHLGEFAGAFRRRYGVAPSEVLAASR